MRLVEFSLSAEVAKVSLKNFLSIESSKLLQKKLRMVEVRATGRENNAESSKANASRQVVIKKLSKSFLLESKFYLKLGKLADTNLGSFNMEAFRSRIMGVGSHRPNHFSQYCQKWIVCSYWFSTSHSVSGANYGVC